MNSYTLRDYQQEAVDTALAHNNGIIVAPTGSGKSLIVAGIVNATEKKSIIFQPNREILEQNFEKITNFGFDGATIYSASLKTKEIGKATFATIGSVVKKPEEFLDCDTMIIDECHQVNSKGGMYLEFIKAVRPKKIIGLTATPYRLHTSSWGAQIKMLTRTRPKVFNDIIHVTQTQDLIEHGYLLNPEFIIEDAGVRNRDMLRPNTTGANYSDSSIREYFARLNIAERLVYYTRQAVENNSKHILVFTQSISESNRVLRTLQALGISVETVTSDTPSKERKQLITDFKSGKIRVMVNVGVLTTGFDFPELDCLVIGRPTMSLALWYQMVGRVVRPFPNKQQALVYDICGNYSVFGNPLHLTIARNGALWDIFSEQGRLTTKFLHEAPQHEEPIKFGKYKGLPLGEVPLDYLQWVCDNSDHKPTVTMLGLEIKRRELYTQA